MKPYEKVDTVFERDENFQVTDKVRREVYSTISDWVATEKIDGTNIRIIFTQYERSCVSHEVRGKSDNASIPPRLLNHCNELADTIADDVLELMQKHQLDNYTLYGEGFGAGIQKGGAYGQEQRFICFDIRVGAADRLFYLTDDAVSAACAHLKVLRVPVLGRMSLATAVTLVRDGMPSLIGSHPSEGVVLRPVEPLYDNRGERIMIKIKTADFKPSSPKPNRRTKESHETPAS